MVKKFWPIILVGILILIGVLLNAIVPGKVRKNDTVTIHYTLTLEDGTVYDSTFGREPLTTTLGQGLFIASFEEQLLGMRQGEVKTFTLPPARAFGEYRSDLIGTVGRSWLPEGVEPEVGKQVETTFKDGTPVIAIIKDFDDTSITLDANHPLAGHTLTFDIKIVTITANQTSTNSSRMALSWIILATGVSVFGFVYFSTRNKRRFKVSVFRLRTGVHADPDLRH